MALITKIKVGSVSSLSDARYFAGMGVDWLGFDVNADSESYVSPELYKNMTGWVAGPKRVIEFTLGQSEWTRQQAIEQYSPDGVQFDLDDPDSSRPKDLIAFATAHLDSIAMNRVNSLRGNMEYLVLDLASINPLGNINLITTISKNIKILLRVDPDVTNAKQLLTELPIAGFALKGSKELKTGLKEYDYSELLESLDDGD